MGERISRMQGTGVGSGLIMEEDPNALMQRETMSQAQHAEHNIQKQREYERLQKTLFEEFSKIDVNQDGAVSLDEIIAFLQSKVVSVTEGSLRTIGLES